MGCTFLSADILFSLAYLCIPFKYVVVPHCRTPRPKTLPRYKITDSKHYTIWMVWTGTGMRFVSGMSCLTISVSSLILNFDKFTASLQTSLVTHICLSSRKNLTSFRIDGRLSSFVWSSSRYANTPCASNCDLRNNRCLVRIDRICRCDTSVCPRAWSSLKI